MKTREELLSLFPNLNTKYVGNKLDVFKKWLDDIDNFNEKYPITKLYHYSTINKKTNKEIFDNKDLLDILLSIYKIYYYLESVRYDITIFDEWAESSKSGLLMEVSSKLKYMSFTHNNFLDVLYKACFIDTMKIIYDSTQYGEVNDKYYVRNHKGKKIDLSELPDLNFYVVFKKIKRYIEKNGIVCLYDPDSYHAYDYIYEQNREYSRDQLKQIFSNENMSTFEFKLLSLDELEKFNFKIHEVIREEKMDQFFLKFIKHHTSTNQSEVLSNYKPDKIVWLYCAVMAFYKYLVRCFCPFWLFDFSPISKKLEDERVFGHISNYQYISPWDMQLSKPESVFFKDLLNELRDKLK